MHEINLFYIQNRGISRQNKTDIFGYVTGRL